jgi:hypothetical protein
LQLHSICRGPAAYILELISEIQRRSQVVAGYVAELLCGITWYRL